MSNKLLVITTSNTYIGFSIFSVVRRCADAKRSKNSRFRAPVKKKASGIRHPSDIAVG